jgi:hypothetical protein
MSNFQREDRYIVIKRSDLEKLRGGQTEGLRQQLAKVSPLIPKRECLVIESDWPEYGPAWQMIEQRMTGAATIACGECMGTGGIGRLETCKHCKGSGKIAATRASHIEEPLGVEPVVERQPPEKVDHPNFLEFAICDTCAAESLCCEVAPNEHLCGGCYWAPINEKAHVDELAELQAKYDQLISDCWAACGGNGPANRDDLLTALRLMDESEDELQATIAQLQGVINEVAEQFDGGPEHPWIPGFNAKKIYQKVMDLCSAQSVEPPQ